MATLTLKQVPDPLYRRLKERAAAHRRSLSNEAILCLEKALEPTPETRPGLEEIRQLRRQLSSIHITDDDLRQARDQGRPSGSAFRS